MPRKTHSTTRPEIVPPRLAGIELGGTKAIAVLGDGCEIIERYQVRTADAETTLANLRLRLEGWNKLHPIAALGIASFGPVGIIPGTAEYGRMLRTPKPGWTGADVFRALSEAIAGPTRIDLDVNAAALAEGEWGAARGCVDHCYITVGTGIGVGIVSGGRLVTGKMHPEAGHMRVPRLPGDDFAGICEYHGDCLAGLASGPALAARAGKDGRDIPFDHPLWHGVVDAIAEGCATLFMTLASERIVIGGGVAVDRPEVIDAVAQAAAMKINGFPPFIGSRAPIYPAALAGDAGPKGALLIADKTLSDRY